MGQSEIQGQETFQHFCYHSSMLKGTQPDGPWIKVCWTFSPFLGSPPPPQKPLINFLLFVTLYVVSKEHQLNQNFILYFNNPAKYLVAQLHAMFLTGIHSIWNICMLKNERLLRQIPADENAHLERLKKIITLLIHISSVQTSGY